MKTLDETLSEIGKAIAFIRSRAERPASHDPEIISLLTTCQWHLINAKRVGNVETRERQPNERGLEACAWEIFVAQVSSGHNGRGEHLPSNALESLALHSFSCALAFREHAARRRALAG